MISIRNNVQQRVAAALPPPGRKPIPVVVPVPTVESLAQPNFSKVFEQIDETAKGLIAEAVMASGNERRAAARIVVEGVRLFEASESATDEWADLIQRELTDRGIKVNEGENKLFRMIANLLFRGFTKSKDDADLADSMISRGQITRYAQAMAWAHKAYKTGTDLVDLADKIIVLGGIRKVADLWSYSQRSNEVKSTSAIDAELASEVCEDPEPVEVASAPPDLPKLSLPMIGRGKLEEVIVTPLVCVIYPDGKLFRAPLSPETMTAMVAQWVSSQ